MPEAEGLTHQNPVKSAGMLLSYAYYHTEGVE